MHRIKQLTLIAGDLISMYFGLYLAIFLRYFKNPPQNQVSNLSEVFSGLFLISIIISFIIGLYDLNESKNNKNFFAKIAYSATTWSLIGTIFFYLLPNNNGLNPKTILALTAICGFGFVALWRYIYNKFLAVNLLKTKIFFIGQSEESKKIIETLNSYPQLGYKIVFDIKEADLIVLDFQTEKNEKLTTELYEKIFNQVSVIDLADFYEKIYNRIPPFTFSQNWFLTRLEERNKKIYDRFVLIINYLSVIPLGLFFIITFPIIASLIKLSSRGPIIFKQCRIGRGGKKFIIYKYRTMKALSSDGSAETNGAQYASDNDNRITLVGKFLRSIRLDEVPQFFNILKNEMNLIGPRPERPEFVDELTKKMPFYPLRHLVKPGLTGWAQLQKNYYGTIDENLLKLEYDLFYIKNRGPFLDLAIILKTFKVVFGRIGR